MLKYRINKDNFEKNNILLPVTKVEFTDLSVVSESASEDKTYEGPYKNKILVVCDCDDLNGLMKGSVIETHSHVTCDYTTIVNKYPQDDSDNPETEYLENIQTYNFVNKYLIKAIHEGERTFSFLMDKYIDLKIESIRKPLYESDDVFIYLKEPHVFDVTDGDDIVIKCSYLDKKLVVTDVDEKGENVDKEMLGTVEKEIKCRYINPTTLVFDSSNEEYEKIMKLLFPVTNLNGNFDYLVSEQTGNLTGLKFYRDTFLYGEKDRYDFYFSNSRIKLDVPLTNTFETNIWQMELLNEQFVEVEKKKAINRIVDIEKDVYYPSTLVGKNQFEDIYTIKFNLHFREHRGDDWLVDQNYWWNGVKSDWTNEIKIERIKEMTDSNVADLLFFLGFTNDDIRYQKNKLKKSFLRLSYYDSPNPANQNMLGYSTIFFNAGDMFARYMKYMEEGNYVQVKTYFDEEKAKWDYERVTDNGVYDETVVYNKTGIRVDRDKKDFDEEKRLAAQFVVKDKNTSTSSSDGFYVYIWKDNESALPQDLYMKVEFNHAGYGRTVPFMMPYYDKVKHNEKDGHIKTFDEILKDFQRSESEVEQGKDGPYGMRQYLKYSYIHFKYQYDKENEKHRYYLDTDTYGKYYENGINGDKNELVINLYEAKVV